ncbi:MAG: hypothetical protein AAF405_10565, partial [Pseudomonadota bacterium]
MCVARAESLAVLANLAEVRQDISMWCRPVAFVLLPFILLLLAAGSITKLTATAQAQSVESPAEVALLVASCTGCHADPASNPPREDPFPQIFGRPSSEIREAML